MSNWESRSIELRVWGGAVFLFQRGPRVKQQIWNDISETWKAKALPRHLEHASHSRAECQMISSLFAAVTI